MYLCKNKISYTIFVYPHNALELEILNYFKCRDKKLSQLVLHLEEALDQTVANSLSLHTLWLALLIKLFEKQAIKKD